MESVDWNSGGPSARRPTIVLPDGDVWVGSTDISGGRRFRYHLGHVVEVFDSGRIRRVGPALGYARPWLLADGPLEALIERTLALEAPSSPQWQESASVPVDGAKVTHGLLGRLAALLQRSHSAPLRDDAPSTWHDTMPWTR